MIEVRGLAKYYGRQGALHGLDLAIAPGDFIALFGRNGAGKSTFLRILAGLRALRRLLPDRAGARRRDSAPDWGGSAISRITPRSTPT